MPNEKKAIDKLTDIKSKVSCHYFIKKNGKVILMVPELYVAWHAGISNWKNFESINKFSIGIEVQNRGHAHGYHKFSMAQINSIISLCSKLIKKYKIQNRNVLAHSDVSYNRKIDPGEKFPWYYLSSKGVGIYPKEISKFVKKTKMQNIKGFFKNLHKIGYRYLSVKFKKKIIKNFQRRFRQRKIDGILDSETMKISQVLAKKPNIS